MYSKSPARYLRDVGSCHGKSGVGPRIRLEKLELPDIDSTSGPSTSRNARLPYSSIPTYLVWRSVLNSLTPDAITVLIFLWKEEVLARALRGSGRNDPPVCSPQVTVSLGRCVLTQWYSRHFPWSNANPITRSPNAVATNSLNLGSPRCPAALHLPVL